MKTIHNSQSIRSRSEGNAIRDTNLNPTAALVLILINRYINHNPDTAFDLTGEAASERWTMLTARQINNSIAILRDNGYIKVVTSNELFTSTRTISSTVESEKSAPKQKTIDNDKKLAIFDKVWAIWRKKEDGKKAKSLFLKLKISECELVLKAAKPYNDSASATMYVMQLTKYIRNSRWEDELSKSEAHISQRVTAAKGPSASDIAHEKKRAESIAAAKQRKLDRIEEYGWDRPYPSVEDYKMNSSRIQKGGADDVEACQTYRLKRDGLMNKNNKK
tara:strand:- start:1619 stop:2449 length:831 start_codon:yes stop_codon:yes gene_type:complete